MMKHTLGYLRGILAMILGGLAIFAALRTRALAPGIIAWSITLCGILEWWHSFSIIDPVQHDGFWRKSVLSLFIGLLLFSAPTLAGTALVVLLGGFFVLDGLMKLYVGLRGRTDKSLVHWLASGLVPLLIGAGILLRWPLSGWQAIGIAVGLHVISAGWSMFTIRGHDDMTGPTIDMRLQRFGLPKHAESARMYTEVAEAEAWRRPIDVYWVITLLLTLFFIHVSRMSVEWSFVGLISPFVAVIGDIVYALLFALVLIIPLRKLWVKSTRPIERGLWSRLTHRVDAGQERDWKTTSMRKLLARRLRFDIRMENAYWSPRQALHQGLLVGLPLSALLVAVNPVWGFNWYFNTENWAAGAWERWVEFRVDDWREQMVRAAREATEKNDDPMFLAVNPPEVNDGDFSFIIIGDTGEGDSSQLVLKDRLLELGKRPDIKFLIVSSDVIYPSGEMKDYEFNFYLPFKGFTKPIYAIPGNHDWYDGLEGFNANFLKFEPARAALRSRVTAEKGITSTNERRINELLNTAQFLRQQYGVSVGHQQGPYFEIQTPTFALIALDTGILRTVDPDQLAWFRGALDRSTGKFVLALLGHPLYAGGHEMDVLEEKFAEVHRLLREHRVPIAMAGDTHDLEYYREPYENGGQKRTMHHFVNGGGGAYLSIGTALDWPKKPALADAAFYPRTDAIIAKLDRETPFWKRPIWFWVKRVNAWPSTPEFLAGMFNFNYAPFYQSFMEVRVEPSAQRVRLIAHGVHGPLKWNDLQLMGAAKPESAGGSDDVEWIFPLTSPK
jgi:uncharacterized membrane protein HdeD (DUF308 family)